MQEIVKKFLEEKGVSSDILNQIMPMLENTTSIDQVKTVLSGFQDKLPTGIMDQLDSLGNVGGMAEKASDAMNSVKGMFGM
jgi:hypothetical protein